MIEDSNEREIQRLETILNRYKQEKKLIEDQSKAKDNIIETLNKRNSFLQSAKNHFASQNLYNRQSSEILEQKLSRLQQFLKEQAYQTQYLERSRSSVINHLESLQKSLAQCNAIIDQKDMLIQNLKLQIKGYEEVNKLQQNQIQTLNKKIQEQFAQKSRLIQTNATLAANSKQKHTQKEQKFKLLFQGLNTLNTQIKQKNEPNFSSEDKSKQYRLIIKAQMQELQDRNEQILRLRTMLDGPDVPAEEAHLRNTIKHLRGELAKYNKMFVDISTKESFAQSRAKEYQDLIEIYNQQLIKTYTLNNQNLELKKSLGNKQEEFKALKQQFESSKKIFEQTKKEIVEVVKQNVCYHQLMFQTYGQNQEFYIRKSREDYVKRMQQRARREKWANVEELIEANQRLRIRLKLQ